MTENVSNQKEAILSAISSINGAGYWQIKKKSEIGGWQIKEDEIPVVPGQGDDWIKERIMENKTWGGSGKYKVTLFNDQEKVIFGFPVIVSGESAPENKQQHQESGATTRTLINDTIFRMRESMEEKIGLQKLDMLRKTIEGMDGDKKNESGKETISLLLGEINSIKDEIKSAESKKQLSELETRWNEKIDEMQQVIINMGENMKESQEQKPGTVDSMTNMFLLMQKMDESRDQREQRAASERERIQVEQQRWREELQIRRDKIEIDFKIEQEKIRKTEEIEREKIKRIDESERRKIEEERREREERIRKEDEERRKTERKEFLEIVKKNDKPPFDAEKIFSMLMDEKTITLIERVFKPKAQESAIDKMLPVFMENTLNTVTTIAQKGIEMSMQQMGAMLPNPITEKMNGWIHMIKSLGPEIYGVFEKIKEIEIIKNAPGAAINKTTMPATKPVPKSIPKEVREASPSPTSNPYALPESEEKIVVQAAQEGITPVTVKEGVVIDINNMAPEQLQQFQQMIGYVENSDPNFIFAQLRDKPEYIKQIKASGAIEKILDNHPHPNVQALMEMIRDYVLA
jgi:hypothetical protein